MHGTIYEFERLPEFQRQGAGHASSLPAARAGVPLVGIIRNPRSHRNKGQAPELADCSNILTETPQTRAFLHECLARFARRGIDYLVIDGGDGTVRDVLSCGAEIFGDEWPALIVLPKGKTNALAVDLGLPGEWSLTEALVAVQQGRSVTRHPLRITSAKPSEGCAQGFILGAGVFTLATELGQETHRRGAFNSFAVGVTILWGLLQMFFGRLGNRWRSCTRMRMRDAQNGEDLPYSGRGNPDERFLMVATTFENFPLGAKPFGKNVRPGIKLGILDWPARWIIMLMPAILYGLRARFLENKGVHRLYADAVDLELDGSFILDGESFPAGRYTLQPGPLLNFVIP